MTGKLLIFGMGYTAGRLAARLRAAGWQVTGIRRMANDDCLAIDDGTAIAAAVAGATHILSSVPPANGADPVLQRYGRMVAVAPAGWIGYLSSTGVYGDAGGAWVDESAETGSGRRSARAEADLAWQALRSDARIFRLPGIYGPGRSAIDRVRDGRAHRIDLPDQVFSRIHVDDIVAGIVASLTAPAGVYNFADDHPCSQNRVIEHACALLGVQPPPLQTLETASLSPMAREFYAETRRVSNRKAKRILGWRLDYPDYKQGLDAIFHNKEQNPH